MKELIKQYKKWVLKATNAAKAAEKNEQPKEQHPEYVAADNVAKTLWAKIKPLAVLLIAIFVCSFSQAQNAKQDANGNFVAIKSEKAKEPAKATGKTFTDNKGKVYHVYVSKNGKYFYYRTSKAGNEYKVYLQL